MGLFDSVSGGGGSQKSSSVSYPATLSILPILLGQAFGLNPGIQKRGGLSFTRNAKPDATFVNKLFGPETFQPLQNLFNPIDTNIISGTPLVKAFGNQALGNAGSALDMFSNTLMPGAQELATTGFRTSIDPYIAQAKQRFTQDFLPQAAAQFGSLGLDPGDSDFGAAIAREAARISTDLGAQDVALQEAANARRMQGIPLAGELAQGSALLPINLGQDILGYESAAQQGQFASSPAGQLLNQLMLIAGVPTQGQTTSSSRSRAFNFDFALGNSGQQGTNPFGGTFQSSGSSSGGSSGGGGSGGGGGGGG